MKEIEAFYHSQYDFNATIHNRFIEEMYELEKDNEYAGNTKDFSVEALRKRYYAEHCFNLIRQKEGTFICYDRENIAAGYEKMDLYEKNTATMFAVKKGKASSTLCYAVDQSLTALKMYKQDKTPDWPEIKNVGLWFILEIKTPLHTDEQYKVDLSSLNMLMLKNRLDHWKKEVRLAGFKRVYPELCVNSKLAQNRARIILGRKTAVRDSALAAS